MDTNDFSSDFNYQLDVCVNFLETLNGNISYNANIVQWFNEFCEHLSKLILLLSEIKKRANVKYSNYDDLLFYLNQVITCLSLLMRVLIRESNVNEILYDGRICAKKQMKWCLTGIHQFMCEDSAKSQQIGTFIKWMDAALDKISEIDYEVHKLTSLDTFNEAKILFDEVLSHAMSIAQVTLNKDYKIIRGSSQIVLEFMDSLYKELTKEQPNIPMLNLLIDTCTEKLCSLEQRVNVAVLRLSLKVFSAYTDALDDIYNFCSNPNNNGKLGEFDNLVVEFDLHVDRIMQIGLFALSCSTCRNSCIRIRSCLASLEALESELVPALSSILLEKTSYKINLALLLKEHWLNQAIILRKQIFLIIDPHAFCQVIYEENKELLDNINEKIKMHNSPLDRKSIDKLIDQSNVMKQFVKLIIDEQLQDVNIDEVKKAFRDFKNVLHEVEAAKSILLTNRTTPNDEQRMYKRCKILLNCTRVLWNIFNYGDDSRKDQLTTSVKDNEIPSINNPFLDHIVNKGKQIFKDTSILYPNRNSTFNIQTFTSRKITELEGSGKKNKAIPLSKLVHLRKLSFIKSPKTETSCKIEITDILNELQDLTNMTIPLESLS